ncbi:MAG: hypothetical protein FJX42_06505 [Alphaproteobacteria bacterium]|nr:hypothetical protein [Alphaproteobacteria bacterium]
MEIAAYVLLAYVFIGLATVTKDLATGGIDRPFWAMRPTLAKAIFIILTWPMRSIVATQIDDSVRSYALGLVAPICQLITITILIWGAYSAAELVFDNIFLQLVLAIFIALVGVFFVMPLGLLIGIPVSLVLVWIIDIFLPRKKKRIEKLRSGGSFPTLLSASFASFTRPSK